MYILQAIVMLFLCAKVIPQIHANVMRPLCVLFFTIVYIVLPRSIAPRFLAYRQNSRLSRFPPLKIPRYTAKLNYRHSPQVFRHKSRKTNLNSPVSTAKSTHRGRITFAWIWGITFAQRKSITIACKMYMRFVLHLP
jgi:hypothetical protein